MGGVSFFEVPKSSNRGNQSLLKDNEYSLNGFSVTENSFRIFESTNHRRGRENSNLKIGPTLDQGFAKLGPNFGVNSAKISSIWSKD